ncbi:lonely Cys domain-containing protein [Streptomyces sp. M19]
MGQHPYVVLAEGRHDMVRAQLPDGSTRELDIDTFVELVAADLARQGLPKDAPVVLGVPFAGDRYLELPRKLAQRTGRSVWVHSGLARRHPDPAALNTLAVIQRDGLPKGAWLEVRPGLAPDPDDDAPGCHGAVVSQPIVSSLTGEQIGRSLHTLAEFAGVREDTFSLLDQMTWYVHKNPATGTFSVRMPLPDPGPRNKAYRLAGHGLPGHLEIPMEDGERKLVGKRQAGSGSGGARACRACPRTTGWI